MTDFKLHDQSTAPQAAHDGLAAVWEKYGFVPNLIAVMAAAPPLMQAYLALSQLWEQTSFSAQERNLILLAISAANDCDYCVAAHTLGARAVKLPEDIIKAVREGKPLSDARLEALRQFAQAVANDRGRPSPTRIQVFFEVGYTRTNLLEIILAVGMKALSNYTNHLAETPIDAAFEQAAWRRPAR
jgi:uncharacterized peroxidase-related enzyme